MPFLCVAISQAARNQVRRPRWLPCSAVPAVTETCRPQAAHCRVSRSRASSQPLSCPQAGQRNPSGQRSSSSQRAQAASSGNRASNSGSDRGSSVISSPFMSLHATYGATGARGMSHSAELLVPLAPADQHLVRGGLESDDEAQETLEGGGGRVASIEAERELVEVGLEVRRGGGGGGAPPPPAAR